MCVLVQSYDGVNCVYRRTPAFGCGIAGAAAVLAGQAVVAAAVLAPTTAASPLSSPQYSHGTARLRSIAGGVRACRLLATVSAAAFVVGAFRSQSGERRRREDGVETYYRCTVLVSGVFAGASSLAFLAAAVGIAS
uniref:CASP-like protein n=1 Tax=Oryza barthii TaxID=65489 RepID=A0A0D3HSW4_9ORYZ